MAAPNITGGCLCGAVRFSISAAPIITRQCWCRDCQYLASGNATVNVCFPADAVQITGETSAFHSRAASGNQMLRRFCPSCGTPLTSAALARPHLIFIRAGALDDPNLVKPAMNIWTASAPEWVCLDPTLPATERQPPPAG
ncbi:MAG: GFA family protein [Acidocella sp.]|uniref:GFA family protein n=1 Tax=Acidocella sp. TaxID=50710 RepID=UPI003FC69044